jgi:SOS-response transcriptional repressor LexA
MTMNNAQLQGMRMMADDLFSDPEVSTMVVIDDNLSDRQILTGDCVICRSAATSKPRDIVVIDTEHAGLVLRRSSDLTDGATIVGVVIGVIRKC